MHRTTNGWATAVAAAALLATPIAAAAQTTGTQQPPAQTQPQQTPQAQPQQTPPAQPQQTPPAQPQQTPPAQPPAAAQPPAGAQVDAAAAKQHLSEARDALSQLTSLPEASKLQGESRTQVSQLISNFNELITTQSDWRSAYAKVDANLTSLLGPDSADPAAAGTSATAGTTGTAGTASPTGTSGTTPAAAAEIEPAIRAKLVEVRTHLKKFEQAAGGQAASSAMAPSAAPDATANPANPANPATPAAPANPPAPSAAPAPSDPASPPSGVPGATGTSGVTPSPTASMDPKDREQASAQVNHAEADKHLDAISAILNSSKTGALTRAQTTELKKHVDELRQLLQKQDK